MSRVKSYTEFEDEAEEVATADREDFTCRVGSAGFVLSSKAL